MIIMIRMRMSMMNHDDHEDDDVNDDGDEDVNDDDEEELDVNDNDDEKKDEEEDGDKRMLITDRHGKRWHFWQRPK